MKRLAVAALLAGLVATPAWAQDQSINCPDGTVAISAPSGAGVFCRGLEAGFSPPKTNLDAAWRACQDRETEALSVDNAGHIWNYKWTAALQAPCSKVEALINARERRAMDKAAAKEEANQEAQDKAALATIERGLSDPDGKPK